MGETWLKIKAWTKGILVGALVLYVILFVFKNGGHEFQLWWFFGHSSQFDVLYLALIMFVAGAVCLFLIETTWRTARQMRDLRSGRRLEKLEREQAELRAKAAMLQTHPVAVETVRVEPVGDGN